MKLSTLMPWLLPSRVRVPTRLQFQTTECGVASLVMILAYHGIHVSMEAVREVSGASRDCTNAADMVRAAKHFGLPAKAYKREPDDLRSMQYPFVAHLRFIHFVVVEGFTATHVLINDPACGRHEVPLEEFHEDFTGIVITFGETRKLHENPSPLSPLAACWLRTRETFRSAPLYLVLATLCGAGTAVPLLVIASATGALVDQPGRTPDTFWLNTCLALLAFGVLGSAQREILGRLQQHLSEGMTHAMVNQLLALPYRFFAYRLPFRLQSTISTADSASQTLCKELLPVLVKVPAVMLLIAGTTLVNSAIGIVLACLCGVFALVLAALFRWRSGYARVQMDEADQQLLSLAASLESVESLKLNGQHDDFVTRNLARSASKQMAVQFAGMSRIAIATVTRVVSLAVIIIVLGLGINSWHSGALSAGNWLTIALLACAVVLELQNWPRLHRKLDSLQLSLLHVEDFFGEPPAPDQAAADAPTDDEAPLAPGAFALRDIVFGYAAMKPPLIDGLSLVVAPGEVVGITGPSGSGKSTLGGLLSGLHKPLRGRVLLGAANAGKSRGRHFDSDVAWVSKQSVFFEGSVRENLCLWQPDCSPGAIEAAVKDACMEEVLALRPGGLDGVVEMRGRNFSGGQRQRLEIARALMRNPAIVVLDEATDALNPALETRLRDNIRKRGCTLVVISHRSSTLAACDRVISLERGRIVSDCAPVRMAATMRSGSSLQRESTIPAALRFDFGDIPVTPDESDSLDAIPMTPVLLQDLKEAFTAVASVHGRAIALPESEEALLTEGLAPLLNGLARRNGMRVRRVRMLEKAHWHMDHGPLIVVVRNPLQIAALLPEGSRYRLAGKGVAANAISADTLHEECFCLYADSDLAADRKNTPLHWMRCAFAAASIDFSRALSISAVLWCFVLLLPLSVLWLLHQPLSSPLSGFRISLSLAALLGAAGLLEYARQLALLRFDSHVESAVMARLYQHLVRITPAFATSKAPDQLIRSVKGFQHLLDSVRGKTLQTLLDSGSALLALLALGVIDMRLAVSGFAVLVPLMLIPVLTECLALPVHKARFTRQIHNKRFLSSALNGIARLRVLNADAGVLQRWRAANARTGALDQQLGRFANITESLSSTYLWLAICAWVSILSVQFQAAPSVLTASTLLLWAGLTGALGIGSSMASWIQTRDYLQDAQTLMDAPLDAQGIPPALNPAALIMEHVTFGYPGTQQPAIRDVSLRIEPGELVVLAGPSGGGKSTLVRLLLGFDTPQSGQVRYGDTPIQALDMRRWQERFGAVMQDACLESASTLRSQISGIAPCTLEQVWQSAVLAGLGDDIRAMPMGMQTIVESNKLSTGQEQRVLIAKSLLRKPSLLILDEATNAIPEQVQAEVISNLRALGITCVLVSHRESTIALADHLFVIEDGSIVLSGPPAVLETEPRLRQLLRAEHISENPL